MSRFVFDKCEQENSTVKMKLKSAVLLIGLAIISAGGVLADPFVSTNNAAETTKGTNSQSGYKFDGVALNDAFDAIGSIIGRTMLVHPDVSRMSFSVSIQGRDKSELVEAFKKILHEKEVAVISDGDKFDLVVPTPLEKTFSSLIQTRALPNPDNSQLENILLHYNNVDLHQVLDVYGDLIGRKLAQQSLPFGIFKINTQTPLTKAEVVHAFDVLFAFQGIQAVNVGDNSFKIVSLSSDGN